MFVDRVLIEVAAGDGGRGSSSFRREKYIARGGPDGGDGGHGGSVILRAQPGVDSLAALSHRMQWRAQSGHSGGPANCHGRSAEDIVLLVPPGTMVIDAATRLVLKDLAIPGESIVAAKGGSGGFGNVHFKTSTNRAPRDTTPGGKGEVRRLLLELKVIADVGLVGKPNAGKSTLLSRLSRARPQIADYAFTTKFPMLGIVAISRDRSFVMADLPGLIEGAHAGHGLGHEFLRHVERAGLLVHVVEPQPVDGSDPLTNYHAIREELVLHDPILGQRQEIVVVSKAELPGAEEVRLALVEAIGRDVLAVSAVTGQGLDRLLAAVVREMDRPAEPAVVPVASPPAQPAPLPSLPAPLPAQPAPLPSLPATARARSPVCLGDTVVVADVGNTRIKLAVVEDHESARAEEGGLPSRLPTVGRRQDLMSRDFHAANLQSWLRLVAPGSAVVLVASVHDAAAAVLEMALAEESATSHRPLRQRRITAEDLPLVIRGVESQRIGMDRLAAAAAANLLRTPGRGAIVIDCGTAATVDMLSAEGEFLGGAILPGPALMARALAEGTSRLPEVQALERSAPPAMPGRSTHEAIGAGIGWGMQGAVARLVEEARETLGADAEVFLTGGWMAAVREALPGAIEVPDLVLAGIALAAPRACAR